MAPTGLAAPNVVLSIEELIDASGVAAGTCARLFCCGGAPAEVLLSVAGAVVEGAAALAVSGKHVRHNGLYANAELNRN